MNLDGRLQFPYSNTLIYFNYWNWKRNLSSCGFICCCLHACSTECIHHIWWYCSASFFFASYSSYFKKAWNDTLSNSSYYIMACKWSRSAKVNRSYKLNSAISDTKKQKISTSEPILFKTMQQNLRKFTTFWTIFKIYLFRFSHCKNFCFSTVSQISSKNFFVHLFLSSLTCLNLLKIFAQNNLILAQYENFVMKISPSILTLTSAKLGRWDLSKI